jgi:hypothetical protein
MRTRITTRGRHQQRPQAKPAPTPSWRDRVKLPESRARSGAPWTPSEAEETSQRRQPPVRRWRSPERLLGLRRPARDSSSGSRAWSQCHQDPPPLRAPRCPNISRLGGGHAADPVVHEQWDSEISTKDARSNQRQWLPNTSHDDDNDSDGGDDDDDDDEEEEEEEDSDEQSNFTLKPPYSPPVRSYERWQNDRADDRLQGTKGPIRSSHDGHVDVLPGQVPSWHAHRQLSHRIPARRWSQSENGSQDSQVAVEEEPATQSLATNSADVKSYLVHPTRRNIVETDKVAASMVRIPPRTFEAGQAPDLVNKHGEQVENGEDNWSDSDAHSTSKPDLVNKHGEQVENGEDNWSDSDAHSTSKRRPSTLGKRKATLKHDLAIVDCGSKPGEALVAIKPKASGCESETVKSRSHGTTKSHRKRCQHPQGCEKGAIGRTLHCTAHGGGKRCQYYEGCSAGAEGLTMLCRTHGGGKRCQYPDGCDKGAEGSTMFCIAHGGGKRCQYPEGCGKGAQGATTFCAAHGGGKRCQYPEGCDKSAQGATTFCAAHGGGKRCQYPDGCDKIALGATLFCAVHGGGKRCQYPEGCDKGTQGSTMFCTAHGGGKKCQYPEGCVKSARGSTMFCRAHGGGKRCQYPEGCSKGAEGRTLFCKAHGGGKRCQYPDGCSKSAKRPTLFCKAHGGGRRCSHESGCQKHVIRGGLCKSHGADA